MIRKIVFIFFILLLAENGFSQIADGGPCGVIPKGKPQRIKGGEGVPPLPLPATPLRRTERKRQPSPPVLIGKITWGQKRTLPEPDGTSFTYFDWNLDPSDVRNLTEFANRNLVIWYKPTNIDLNKFSFDPDEIPILYITGFRPISLNKRNIQMLREYLLAGGFLWGDACRGSKYFSDSFRNLVKEIFPEAEFSPLPLDHPLYHSFATIEKVKYSQWVEGSKEGAPMVEGINIGCRTAIIFNPYGLSCSWDSNHIKEGARIVLGEDAMKIGLNMISYCLGYYNAGRYLANPRKIVQNESTTPGSFVFAQVQYNGDWDPCPPAFINLIRETHRSSNVPIEVKREEITFNSSKLLDYPFLYLTGGGKIILSSEEKKGLKSFIENGGFILADSCLGNLEFDRSFRTILLELFPQNPLTPIAPNHQIFNVLNKIQSVSYSPRALKMLNQNSDMKASESVNYPPYLEGVEINGSVRVVYSKFSLGTGWVTEDFPFIPSFSNNDALKMGVNAIVYSLTH